MRIAFILCCLVAFSAWMLPDNKLEGTRWAGTIYAPSAVNGTFEFKKDSTLLWVDGAVIETMGYRVAGDTLELKKLDGTSPCTSETGVYRYSIANDVLKVEPISDGCAARVAAWDQTGYKKQ